MVFPLVIAVAVTSISCGMTLYTVLRDSTIEHKLQMLDNYKKYEKVRFYLSVYSDDTVVPAYGAYSIDNCRS